jgi:hypothetical protein
VTPEFCQKHPEFCSHFHRKEDRKRSDYLYRSSDLALLEGRRYDGKRNLIAQIDRVYQWTLSPLDPQILDDLEKRSQKETGENEEQKVLTTILNNYEQLHLKGYMIGIQGKPVAFSIVDVLNPTTKIVFFEKADRHFKGLYQLINRETSKAILEEGYEFINREEDLGIEGLRKSKLSYYPIEIIPSYTLTPKK